MEKSEAYRVAKRRVAAKFTFVVHLAVYILVNGFLIYINLTTSPGYYWFIWPLAGWGIGLLLHGLQVFLYGQVSRLKQEMIEEEMKRPATP